MNNKIIKKFILNFIKQYSFYKDFEDIHIGGSFITGFFDSNDSDIDLFFIIQNLKLWKEQNKNEWKKFTLELSKYNYDPILIDYDVYLKYGKMIKSFSLYKNKYLYNADKDIVPIVIPNINSFYIRIKLKKLNEWYKAYKNNRIFFYNDEVKNKWLEEFNGKNIYPKLK